MGYLKQVVRYLNYSPAGEFTGPATPFTAWRDPGAPHPRPDALHPPCSSLAGALGQRVPHSSRPLRLCDTPCERQSHRRALEIQSAGGREGMSPSAGTAAGIRAPRLVLNSPEPPTAAIDLPRASAPDATWEGCLRDAEEINLCTKARRPSPTQQHPALFRHLSRLQPSPVLWAAAWPASRRHRVVEAGHDNGRSLTQRQPLSAG